MRGFLIKKTPNAIFYVLRPLGNNPLDGFRSSADNSRVMFPGRIFP